VALALSDIIQSKGAAAKAVSSNAVGIGFQVGGFVCGFYCYDNFEGGGWQQK